MIEKHAKPAIADAARSGLVSQVRRLCGTGGCDRQYPIEAAKPPGLPAESAEILKLLGKKGK